MFVLLELLFSSSVAAVAVTVAALAFTLQLLLQLLPGMRPKLQLDPSCCVVAITGCDSGFGSITAQQLARDGFIVIAGCLTTDGAARLQQEQPAITRTIVCDVTAADDVQRFAEAAEKLLREDKKRTMWALVNNAGVAPMGHVDWISQQSCRLAMEVNYFGLFAVTQRFLPLLKRTRNSRIINVSSAAGFSGLPNMGVYCASKHAVEGLGKCLRQELAPWGVHVCHINPGFMRTPLIQSSVAAAEREFTAAPKAVTDQYDFRNMEIMQQRVVEPMQEDPQIVVDAIAFNIAAASPLFVNAVGFQAPLSWALVSYVPQFLLSAAQNFANRRLGIGPKAEAVKAYQQQQL